jgi:hypothetical protein
VPTTRTRSPMRGTRSMRVPECYAVTQAGVRWRTSEDRYKTRG